MVLRVQGVVLPFVVHSVPNRSFAQPSVQAELAPALRLV